MSQEVLSREELKQELTGDKPVLRTLPPKGPQQLPADVQPGEGLPQGDSAMQYLGPDFHLTELGRKTAFQYGLDVNNLLPVKEPIQLVDGTGVGSRHVVQPNAQLFRVPMRNHFPLVAAFFVLKAGPEARYLKTHPEHADVSSDVPGWYVERFQRTPGPGEAGTSRTSDRVEVDASVLPEVYRRID